jgi:glycosyltransferase involved in cell wall biosynthesis
VSSDHTSISVLIPAYNAERFIDATLEGVKKQSISDWEAIVVDDGSTDGTLAAARRIAESDDRIRVYAQENRGQAGARNAAIAAMTIDTRYVIFLDADDVWEPDALKILRDALDANPRALAAHGYVRGIDEHGALTRQGELELQMRSRCALTELGEKASLSLSDPTPYESFLINCCVVTPGCALIRREAIDRVGLFDLMAELPRSGLTDWDYWLRLTRYEPIAFVDALVLNYRIHPGNLSRQRFPTLLADFYIRAKVAREEPNPIRKRLAEQQVARFMRHIYDESDVRLTECYLREKKLAKRRLLRLRLPSGISAALRARRYRKRLAALHSITLTPDLSVMRSIIVPEAL